MRCGLVLVLLVLAAPAAEAATVREVEGIHERIERALKKRSATNEGLIHHLEEGAHLMADLAPPPRPAPTGDVVKDKDQLRAWARARDLFARRKKRAQGKWIEVLGRALILYRVHRQSEINTREEVNLAALAILRKAGGPDAARTIVRGVDLLARQRDFSMEEAVRAHFDALAALQSPEALDRMRVAFVGHHAWWIQQRALETMAKHEDAPGAIRLALVRDLLATYEPLVRRTPRQVAIAAPQAVIEAALEAVQVHAKHPKDTAGKPLDTLALLDDWFRKHQDPKKAPWKD